MGRPNPVLRFAVHPAWMTLPAVESLIAAGHEVACYPEPPNPDVIFHQAAGWDAKLFEPETRKNGLTYYPYVEARLVRARKARKASK